MNTYEHPKITSFKTLGLEEDIGFSYEATGLVVEGEMTSAADSYGMLASLLCGAAMISFFLTLVKIGALLGLLAMGLAALWIFKALFGTPSDTFKVDYLSGRPVWTSTNDEAWARVKAHFVG